MAVELTNEEELDRFADMLEPAVEILKDPVLEEKMRTGTIASAVAAAIKRHKSEVVKILAISDGADPETYKVNGLALPLKLIRLLNRPEMQELFTSQGQKKESGSSGSATENIEDGV